MSETVGAAKLGITADTTGVEAGVASAKKTLASLGQTAKETGDKMSTANATASRSIDRFVQRAEQAAATVGKGATEARLYDLAQRGATQTQLKAAEAALRTVDAFNRQEQASARASAAAARFGAALATGAAIAAAAVLAIGRNSINALDAFNDLADATGASIENISALDRVARENGGTFDQVATTLIRFNKVLTDTEDDGKKAVQVFKALGLDANALRSADPAEALRQTAVALARFADDGDKARAVQILFGKSIAEVAPLLKDLAEKTALVGSASTQAAKDAEDFNKHLNGIKANAQDAARAMVSDLLPALNRVLGAMRTAGGLTGFLTLGGDKTSDPAAAINEINGKLEKLKKTRDELEPGKSFLNSLNDRIFGDVDDINRQIALFEKQKEFLKGLQAFDAVQGAGGATGDALSRRIGDRPSVGKIPEAPKGGKKEDPEAEGKRRLEMLQKIAEKETDLTELQKLQNDLDKKRLGTVGPALERELKLEAQKADAKIALIKLLDGETKARERNEQMQQQVDQAALAGVAQQIATNDQLRQEIELLGVEGSARTAVEQARISSNIALKEEELIMLRNADASATQISALEREIALLRERSGLLGQRQIRQADVDRKDAEKKETDSLRSDLTSALQRAFEDTKGNPLKSFGQALASVVYSRLTRSLAESIADGLLGPLQEALKQLSSSGGSAGGWAGLLMRAFGGGGGSSGGGGVQNFDVDGMFPVAHTGGVIGRDRLARRYADPGVFMGARKYHTGGMAGDEVPAILRKGEGVFTREQMKALGGAAGSSGGGNITIVTPPGTKVDRVTERTTPQGDRVLLLEEVAKGMADPNSPVSRAMGRHFGARPSRS